MSHSWLALSFMVSVYKQGHLSRCADIYHLHIFAPIAGQAVLYLYIAILSRKPSLGL